MKRIGILNGRPIIEGDDNLVKNYEYNKDDIFDTGYYYKIINKEVFYSLFGMFKDFFIGYGFGRQYAIKLQKKINIMYNLQSNFYLDYIYISDKCNGIDEDGDGHINSITKIDNGLQFLIQAFSNSLDKETLNSFKNSFKQITKLEFNKAYLEYKP